MTNKFMRKREKIRAQMKSRFYYWFWGAATITVVSGQFYVGSGYRQMAKSLDRWFDTAIEFIPFQIDLKLVVDIIMPNSYYNDDGVVYLWNDDYIIWKEIDY